MSTTELEQLRARVKYLEARLVRVGEQHQRSTAVIDQLRERVRQQAAELTKVSAEHSQVALLGQAAALEQIGCELYDKFGLTPDQIDYIANKADSLRRQAREEGHL